MRRILPVTAALLILGATAAGAQPYYYPGTGPYPGASPYPGAAMRPGVGTYPGAMSYAPRAPAAAAEPTPDEVVRQGIDRLKGFMDRGGAAQPAEIKAFLNREISPYFDFDYMGKWAGGALYRHMDEQHRRLFAQKLKRLFFSALARNLGTYANTAPRIDVSRPRPRGQREVDVRARVYPEHGYPVNLTFRFYRGKTGWKVFDVTANGTSAVAYYRKYFNQMARRGGIEACCR
jgi:phospholipid transport system substrate-binding protein